HTIARATVPFPASFHRAHSDSVAASAAVLVRTRNRAQVGAIGQSLFTRQAQILLDPPEQIGTRGAGLLPEIKPKEVAIGQTQHSFFERGQYLMGQRDFPV